MTGWIFPFVFPFLLATVVLQELAGYGARHGKTRIPAMVIPLIAVGLVALPLGGLPLARWLFGFNANYSIPLTALLLSRAVRNAFGISLLDDRGVLACQIFSGTAGLALYPVALGLTPWDPYSAGWGFSWLFVLTLLLTMVLAVLKNRFAVVLTAAILAYDLRLLESTNLWDYLVDPFLTVVSWAGTGIRCTASGPRLPSHRLKRNREVRIP